MKFNMIFDVKISNRICFEKRDNVIMMVCFAVTWIWLLIELVRAQETTKIISLSRSKSHECIEPMKEEGQMNAPYFLVPIQPDTEGSLFKLIHFNSDTGVVCFNEKTRFDRVKFSVLSINYGLALNIEIHFVDNDVMTKATQKTPVVIAKTYSLPGHVDYVFISCFESELNASRIDEHLFFMSIENEDEPLRLSDNQEFRIIKSDLDEDKAIIEFRCPFESSTYVYTLTLEKPEKFYLSKRGRNLFAQQLRKLPQKSYKLEMTTTTRESIRAATTESLPHLAKLGFNFKLFVIIAFTLAALFIVVFYAAFAIVKRLLVADKSSLSQQKHNTIATQRSSIRMSDLATISTRQKDTEVFAHTNRYLSRLGIDMISNFSGLITPTTSSNSYATYNTSVVSDTMNSDLRRGGVHLHNWYRLLDWKVDFNSMSEVFEDLARLK